MNYQDRLKEHIRLTEAHVESMAPNYTVSEIANLIADPKNKQRADYIFNFGILQGLKKAIELLEENNELQR